MAFASNWYARFFSGCHFHASFPYLQIYSIKYQYYTYYVGPLFQYDDYNQVWLQCQEKSNVLLNHLRPKYYKSLKLTVYYHSKAADCKLVTVDLLQMYRIAILLHAVEALSLKQSVNSLNNKYGFVENCQL